jgi:hypothetical protein
LSGNSPGISDAPPEQPLFVTDQNFPQPILREAIEKYVLGLRIVSLGKLEARLARGYEDWQVILALRQLGAEGFISNDENMLYSARVVAVIEQTKLSVVVCAGVGHNPVVASGLLLTNLPDIAKRHRSNQPQVWILRHAERRPTPMGKLKEEVERRSGLRVNDFRVSRAVLQEPLL